MTLDAGVLIAASRNDRRFWTWWKVLTERRQVAAIPAPVVAQAWRTSRDALLARVIAGCRCISLDLELARRAGQLCARSRTRDVVDASVVVIAAARGDDVLTTDPDDLERLAAHVDGLGEIRRLSSLG